MADTLQALHPNMTTFNGRRGRPFFLWAYCYYSGNLSQNLPGTLLSHLRGQNFIMPITKPITGKRDEMAMTGLGNGHSAHKKEEGGCLVS